MMLCRKNKIGEGWQYAVYDIGNKQVYKKFHSKWRLFWIITKTIFPFKYNSIWKIPSYVKSSRRRAMDSFRFLNACHIEKKLIGNFVQKNDLDFVQDKVVPLGQYLDKCSLLEGKKVIDDFVALNKIFLQKGFIDKSFNIGKNFGINKSNSVILIDIGELYSDPREIKKQIQNRAWTKHYVVEHISEELRAYFVQQMDDNFLKKF